MKKYGVLTAVAACIAVAGAPVPALAGMAILEGYQNVAVQTSRGESAMFQSQMSSIMTVNGRRSGIGSSSTLNMRTSGETVGKAVSSTNTSGSVSFTGVRQSNVVVSSSASAQSFGGPASSAVSSASSEVGIATSGRGGSRRAG